MRVFWQILFLVLCTVPAWAAESICPGGASPRSDIDWCADFEAYGNAACTTGQEVGCATANGLDDVQTSSIDSFKIKDCSLSGDGPAAVGTGCIYGSGLAGSTGPGYSDKAASVATDEVSFRYMFRFGKGYLAPSAGQTNHFPGIKYSSATIGSSLVTVDPIASNMGWLVENSGNAGSTPSFAMTNNIDSTWRAHNLVWYTIEVHAKMNTSGNADGVFEAWIDNVLSAQYTNINYRGTDTTAHFTGVYAARSYYGHGVPSWKPNLSFDQFVYSKDGTKIGLASGITAGTADTPVYYNACSYSAWAQHRPQLDCSTTAYDGQCVQSLQWRTAPTWVTTPVVNGYVIDSTTPASSCIGHVNKALHSAVSGAGGSGVSETPPKPFNSTHAAIHTHAYLLSTNDYSVVTPLSGFVRYAATTNYDHYIAVCRLTNGNVGVCYNNVGTTTTTDTGAAWSTDAWHEYELDINSSDKVSLFFDGIELLNQTSTAQAVWTWFSDTVSGGPRNHVIGIINYPGAGTFDSYDDDSDIGSSSYVSCEGWGTACPFSTATPTPTPTISIGVHQNRHVGVENFHGRFH